MSADFQPEQTRESALQVYLLGCVDFDVFLALQRLLQYEIRGDRRRAALVLCEHPPMISVGRQGSRAHIRLDDEELHHRHWALRWVNRGGGCVLHLPGQLAVYPIVSLDRLGCDIPEYVRKLGGAIADLLADFSIRGPIRAADEGVWVQQRLLAALGVSVRDWVTGFGAYVNLHAPLDGYGWVEISARESAPMTSLQRERRGPVRPALVRERLIEHFQHRFGFPRVTLFTDHPALPGLTQRRVQPVGAAVQADQQRT